MLKVRYFLAQIYYRLIRAAGKRKLAVKGFAAVDYPVSQPAAILRDDQIELINSELDWHAFTTDRNGRRIGSIHSAAKRSSPQELLDKRVVQLNEFLGLSGKSVMEFGCFEGIHSIALAMHGAKVTGVDARPINLAKTVVRAGLYGLQVQPLLLDLDDTHQLEMAGNLGLLKSDILVHIGVLYHLENPVQHLEKVLPYIKDAILLDTHIARQGTELRREFGIQDPFSGVNMRSKWVTKETLSSVLDSFGFSSVLDDETRDERNGLRWRTLRVKTGKVHV